MLLTVQKVTMNKVVTVNLVIDNVIPIQQHFLLPITNPIILGNEFLDTRFAVLDIGNYTITLCCANYMLTTSLTHDPVYDQHLDKIIAPANTKTSYKKNQERDVERYTNVYCHSATSIQVPTTSICVNHPASIVAVTGCAIQ